MHARSTNAPARAGWRIVIGLALCGLCGCPQAPAEKQPPPAPTVRRLTILTPHNAKIREAFAAGFSDWRETQGKPRVAVDWIMRGTPQCVEYVDRLFTGAMGEAEPFAPDVVFGGGIADHARLAAKGYTMKLAKASASTAIPPELNGVPTRAPDNEWFATGLSSFGFVYNRHDCEQRGIAPPVTWEDLADPRFQGWIGLASPQASGSHRQAMVYILEHLGWEKGWATLLRILANSRAVLDSSASVLDQVDHGVFLAAFAVNFDGLARADASGGRVVYVNPARATAATPDVLSVLKTAKDVELAEDFVRYCLSEPGQVVWGVRGESGGRGSTLYHYPIDPTVYDKYAERLAVAENPYQTDFGLKVDAERDHKLAGALLPLVRAANGDNHVLLQRAWAAVVGSDMDAEALALLVAPPLAESDAFVLADQFAGAAPADADAIVAEWSAKFRARYESVLQRCGE